MRYGDIRLRIHYYLVILAWYLAGLLAVPVYLVYILARRVGRR